MALLRPDGSIQADVTLTPKQFAEMANAAPKHIWDRIVELLKAGNKVTIYDEGWPRIEGMPTQQSFYVDWEPYDPSPNRGGHHHITDKGLESGRYI